MSSACSGERFSLVPLADANKKKPFLPVPRAYELAGFKNTAYKENFLC